MTGIAPTPTTETKDLGAAMAYLLLRWWLGVRALVTGLDKYAATRVAQEPLIDPTTGLPDASGAMLEVPHKFYALTNYLAVPHVLDDKLAREPLLPNFIMSLFYKGLGPALILTGVALILGLGSRISLVIQGLIYIALTVGLVLIKQDEGVAWLGVHLGLIAMALMLSRHETCRCWWRKK